MIAKDSIGFSISENYLTCHLKVEKRISIMDLYDIFKVLGMMRICSWQEFSIFAKPKVFASDEYLSMVYSKKELELKLLNRNIVEKHINNHLFGHNLSLLLASVFFFFYNLHIYIFFYIG